MSLRLLAICGCLWACNAFSQAPASDAAAQVIADCANREHASEIGLTAMEQACPGVTAALNESGDLALLSQGQLEQLSAEGLRQLQLLREDYSPAEHHSDRRVATDSLSEILANLHKQSVREQPPSWFERLMTWLRGLRKNSAHDNRSWLENFEPSARALQITRWILIATVVLLAFAVVVNELRAAGLLRRLRARSPSARSVEIPVASNGSEARIEDAPLSERPSLLLQMIVSDLSRSGRLRSDRSLTHRELGTHANFDTDVQRVIFRRLANLAELLLYGHRSIPATDIDATVREALSLRAQVTERV
jgi:hypothetical protein